LPQSLWRVTRKDTDAAPSSLYDGKFSGHRRAISIRGRQTASSTSSRSICSRVRSCRRLGVPNEDLGEEVKGRRPADAGRSSGRRCGSGAHRFCRGHPPTSNVRAGSISRPSFRVSRRVSSTRQHSGVDIGRVTRPQFVSVRKSGQRRPAKSITRLSHRWFHSIAVADRRRRIQIRG
jgi:hypothetical protein